jgi:hypothetical protein
MKKLTIELNSQQMERLQQEAAERGIGISDLVAGLLAEHIASMEPSPEERKQRMLAALEKLERMREAMIARGVPPIDAVELVRQGREELERRTL